MDKIDAALKDFLAKNHPATPRFEDEPAADVFYRFVAGELEGEELERMHAYLRRHPEARELVSQARRLLEEAGVSETEKVPAASLKAAQALFSRPSGVCPHCGKAITPFKRPPGPQKIQGFLWLAAAVVSFGLSFVFPRYFIQCLVVTALCGLQGILELRTVKSQILIYKSLKESTGETRDLHHHRTHL